MSVHGWILTFRLDVHGLCGYHWGDLKYGVINGKMVLKIVERGGKLHAQNCKRLNGMHPFNAWESPVREKFNSNKMLNVNTTPPPPPFTSSLHFRIRNHYLPPPHELIRQNLTIFLYSQTIYSDMTWQVAKLIYTQQPCWLSISYNIPPQILALTTGFPSDQTNNSRLKGKLCDGISASQSANIQSDHVTMKS